MSCGKRKETGLKEMCLRAVPRHLPVLGTKAVLDIPTPLLTDLVPHLSVCQLDELQPSLNERGISTRSRWVEIIQDIYGPNHVTAFLTEEEAKQKVMSKLFETIFYGYSSDLVKCNITDVITPSVLLTAAKYVRDFPLIVSQQKPLQGLTTEQRPLLDLLEKSVTTVKALHPFPLFKWKTPTLLYVLHRLLDHGGTKGLIFDVQCPILLAWLLQGRGSQYLHPQLKNLTHTEEASCTSQAAAAAARAGEDQDDRIPPCKRSKLDSVSMEGEESGGIKHTVDPQLLCQMFTGCGGPSGPCPWGQIDRLEMGQCAADSLGVLTSALPTFFCLRSLTVHSFATLRYSDVLGLVGALRTLCDSPLSSLTHLDISALPHTSVLEVLLDACPRLTSLHVEIHTVPTGPSFTPTRPRIAESDVSDVLMEDDLRVAVSKLKPRGASLCSTHCAPPITLELPLKTLKVEMEVSHFRTDLHHITAVLRRSPHLSSFHMTGMRLSDGFSESQLVTSLSESNRLLKSLTLEDMKLSECLPEILNLLRGCQLEELHLNDCRLLEKWSNKAQSLHQLVVALRKVPSLHTLSLAQNRLTKYVCVLADLFSGSPPSSVNRLNLSSNVIKPAGLLRFTDRLRTHRPPHQLTLDLRGNEWYRDPGTLITAMKGLQRLCVVLLEARTFTNAMADHISNM